VSERVVLVPYDPAWPGRFAAEKRVLEAVFGPGALVEHVGSTAVPGLGAKPVIDILVGVSALAEAERRVPELEAAGYEYVPEYEAELPERRYFRKPRAVHVHCVVSGGRFWVRHLAFRDLLRKEPEVAAAYFALKRELAARLPKSEYPQAKTAFIEAAVARALA
jgi:GrpB-like predicted nucleotidyltransferase (UPF0157 family)